METKFLSDWSILIAPLKFPNKNGYGDWDISIIKLFYDHLRGYVVHFCVGPEPIVFDVEIIDNKLVGITKDAFDGISIELDDGIPHGRAIVLWEGHWIVEFFYDRGNIDGMVRQCEKGFSQETWTVDECVYYAGDTYQGGFSRSDYGDDPMFSDLPDKIVDLNYLINREKSGRCLHDGLIEINGNWYEEPDVFDREYDSD